MRANLDFIIKNSAGYWDNKQKKRTHCSSFFLLLNVVDFFFLFCWQKLFLFCGLSKKLNYLWLSLKNVAMSKRSVCPYKICKRLLSTLAFPSYILNLFWFIVEFSTQTLWRMLRVCVLFAAVCVNEVEKGRFISVVLHIGHMILFLTQCFHSQPNMDKMRIYR